MLFQRTQNQVKLLGAEVPEPRLLLDFLGFETHVKQIRQKRGADIYLNWYEHAGYYINDMMPEKLFGTGEEIFIPDFVKAPDYEFEIGCYVTKAAVLKTPEEALNFFKEHCYLTILNDWSARDVQKKDMEGLGPTNGKAIIGNSIGPKLVRASDFNVDENGVFDATMSLKVNGEQRVSSNYNSLYHIHPTTGKKQAWSFTRIMTFLGLQNIAVQPGYLIGSGTVGNGCIAEHTAKIDPVSNAVLEPATYPWLKDGDVVTMEVEGIGVLENKVRIAAEAPAKAYVSAK
jgi:2-keto-4-pentenoate hydratase/2-oxohepta-3-ene-1,7-dioic acid hydratase in catechol pathway